MRQRSIPLALATLPVALLVIGCARKPPALPPTAPTPSSPVPAISAAQAREVLAEAIRARPDDPTARLELALFDLRANDLHNAERELIDLWKRFPRFARAPYHLGMLYLTHGYETDAVMPLEAAAALAKDDPQAQVNAALACLRTGRLAEARKYAHAALRLDPERPDPYLLMARLNANYGTASQAIEDAKKYLERSPNPVPGYYLLGRLYARRADRANAELWLKRAVEANPDNAEFWLALGRVYYELFGASRAEEGIRCFEKALSLNPDYWEAHLTMGRALASKRQWKEAVTHLEAAVSNAPQPLSLYYDLGQALLKIGRREEGRKMLAEFQRYKVSKSDYMNGYQRLSRAIEAAPKDRARRYALARFCLSYGQYGAAELTLRETARLLGEDETLRRLLQETEAQRRSALSAVSAPSSGDPATPAGQGMDSLLSSRPIDSLPSGQGGARDGR